MVELFERAGELLQQLVGLLGYPGIALASLLETVFPPLPSELVMPFGGFLVARGELTFVGVVLAGTLGAVIGAIPVYYLGRWADEAIVRRLLRRYGRYIGVSEADLDRALRVFDRYGEAVIFFGRLIPLIRTLITLPAGMQRMPLARFLIFTTLGTAIWTGILVYAGFLLGENWEEILTLMKTYETVMIVFAAIAVLGLALFLIVRHLRRNAGLNRQIDQHE